jgi:SNF2 family DNA or RNA helicase
MSEYPVLLAGVESVAEGHSMNLCNNVILMCCSWGYNEFEQAINRAHRLNSPWPVNVYPIICDGGNDRKLEALSQEKGDAAESVLDGHILGEHTSEASLAKLLNVTRREFSGSNAVTTVDEAELEKRWPPLRAALTQLMTQWSRGVESALSDNETVVPKFEEMKQPACGAARAVTPLWRRRLCAPKINAANLSLWRCL